MVMLHYRIDPVGSDGSLPLDKPSVFSFGIEDKGIPAAYPAGVAYADSAASGGYRTAYVQNLVHTESGPVCPGYLYRFDPAVFIEFCRDIHVYLAHFPLRTYVCICILYLYPVIFNRTVY